MSRLALHGGTPVRFKPFPAYRPIGHEEVEEVRSVVESGILSKFFLKETQPAESKPKTDHPSSLTHG